MSPAAPASTNRDHSVRSRFTTKTETVQSKNSNPPLLSQSSTSPTPAFVSTSSKSSSLRNRAASVVETAFSPFSSSSHSTSSSFPITTQITLLKRRATTKLDRAINGRPADPLAPQSQGWVLRPDLLFDMQINNRGGSAKHVFGQAKARRARSATSTGIREGGRKEKQPQTFAEMEALMYL